MRRWPSSCVRKSISRTASPSTRSGGICCQSIPKAGIDSKLKTLLKNTERQLRGPHTTFEREKDGRWKHVKYPGWIQWDDAPGGLLIAEIRTKVQDHEWQIMEAFIGYLDRHLGEQIDSISVYYR